MSRHLAVRAAARERLQSDDVTIELIKAGDHRLSTPADLARLTAAIKRRAEEIRR